ncbi:MAG TPA: T9SS type A sorting domain-containing protein [Flavisolibacter sp.]|nr:T9SS type A sorting domain-containing protein [Flavisolibacter sp.]
MRPIVFLLLLLTNCLPSIAQLTITPGAQLTLTGNIILCMDNMNFTNNGGFEAGNSFVSFKGNQENFIGGSSPIAFYDLQINKSNAAQLTLGSDIVINNQILFSNGLINMLSFDIDLGTSGLLIGESQNSHLTGSTGVVSANRVLNNPLNANIGNLGMIISSPQNLGMVRVYRFHQFAFIQGTLGSSVQRLYYVMADQNTGLNATVQFNYLDSELNGNSENALSLYQRVSIGNWVNRGYSSRDAANNLVGQTGLDSLTLFTLSSPSVVLPVQFSVFNTRCSNGRTVLTWHTASEQNSQYFSVQRSINGIDWTEAGRVPAAGNSNDQNVYSFTDQNSAAAYYRLAEHDINGRVQHSGVLRSVCTEQDKFQLWPNPTKGMVHVGLVSTIAGRAAIKVYDGKGSLVGERQETVLPGSNQLSVDLSTLPAGVYTILVENGQTRNSTKIWRQ